MEMETKIKGVKSYSSTQFSQYIHDRNEALFSMDKKKIVEFCNDYGVTIPRDADFWVSIAYAILELADIEANDVPPSVVRECLVILDEYNQREGGSDAQRD